jgi:hypothetical protein
MIKTTTTTSTTNVLATNVLNYASDTTVTSTTGHWSIPSVSETAWRPLWTTNIKLLTDYNKKKHSYKY